MNPRMIESMFEEKSNIVGCAYDMDVINIGKKYGESNIYVTDTDELIVFIQRMSFVFDEEVLATYIEMAEELYKETNVHISIFVLAIDCEITMNECNIPSEADFAIKLKVMNDPIDIVLSEIERKVYEGIKVDEEEMEFIKILPMLISDEEKRKEIRIRWLRIMNKIG